MGLLQDYFVKLESKPTSQPPVDDEDSRAHSVYEDLPEEPLTENPFDSEGSRILFDAIDQLQSCDAGQDIDIPQLVIVGGQSTGKSSLLQSLVDIPFPTGQGCCTRFATRIVSRRTPPASNFSSIMDEVQQTYMGIKAGNGKGAKNFATEVLKVELSGPKRSHFSILDIPGIFENDEFVTKSEKDSVKKMVIEYLSRPQNIVICIADAGNDIANQGVFALARQHVEESRLLRVFTKCDNIRPTDVEEVVRIAIGPRVSEKPKTMSHGWFVVRNRRANEGPEFDLVAAEKELFSVAPWTDINETRRGSSMLKKFLGGLLCARIRQEFPSLQQKVKALLKDAVEAREVLGIPRLTHGDRQRYLSDIILKFQEFTKHALNSPGCLPTKEMRVRGFVAARNREFDCDMRYHGHWYDFEDMVDCSTSHTVELTKPHQVQSSVFMYGQQPVTPDASPLPTSRKKTAAKSSPQVPSPNSNEDYEINETDVEGGQNEISKIRDEIREQIIIFQGNGLPGVLNPDIFPVLYRTQTQKWLKMATDHLQSIASDVIKAATSIIRLVEQKCQVSSTARDGFIDIVQNFHNLSYQRAERALIDYMEKESNFPLQATNPAFLQMLEELRMKRAQNGTTGHKVQLKKWIEYTKKNSEVTVGLMMERIDHIVRDLHFDPATRMENDIHDALKVHYELSLRSFIDHVTKRVIEDFISSKNGPLLGLSTTYVLDLSEAETEALAREDQMTVLKREKCDEKIARLERSCAIAETAWKRTTPRNGDLVT